MLATGVVVVATATTSSAPKELSVVEFGVVVASVAMSLLVFVFVGVCGLASTGTHSTASVGPTVSTTFTAAMFLP
jgi:hypothetical protein